MRTFPLGAAAFVLLAPPALAAGVLAGAAKVDITPDRPICLSGYGARTAPSEGIEDPLHVRALAIKDTEGTPTVIVSLDAIGTPGWLWERTVGAIRGRTGIYHVRLAIASTHTHFAPCLAHFLERTLPTRRMLDRLTPCAGNTP